MDGGLLSLKWNNHKSTLFYMLSTVRKKECYTDVTLACDGKFYSVHKLVLSMCSEYFEQMFEQTQCKHPVIVLKDIKSEELESLLSYMYAGEVNVVQEKLSGLIKAAECLRIKGLAVPDEEPCSKTSTSREKRSSDSLSSEPKRRRQDDGGNSSSFRQSHSNNRNDDRRKSLDHSSSSTSNKFRNTNSSSNVNNSTRPSSGDRESGDRGSASNRTDRLSSPTSNNQQHSAVEVKTEELAETSEAEAPDEVLIEESPQQTVKEEPTDADAVYLSDSNSVPDHKEDVLLESFSDVGQQQHFMDELLGQTSESNQGNVDVGDYSEGGEGSSGAGSQQQQHMVGMSADGSSSTLLLPLPSSWASSISASINPEMLLENNFLQPSGNSNEGHHNHRMKSGGTSASCDDFDPQQHQLLGTASSHASGISVAGPSADIHDALGASPSTMKYISNIQANQAKSGTVPMFAQLDLSRLRCSEGRGIACPLCLKFHRDKFNFKDHYVSHSGEKPLACHLCSYRCVRKRELWRHTVTKHT